MGNLPFSTTSDELATMFGRVGIVTSAQVITDRETGRSRGFGFVEMSDEDARKAIDELTGQNLGGRSITVNEARPRAPRGGGGAATVATELVTARSVSCRLTTERAAHRSAPQTFVMAPVSAPCTNLAYLPSTPLV